MNTQPFTKTDLCAAVAHLSPLTANAPSKAAFAAYGVAVTAFSALESAYVPNCQTDTALRNEVRDRLAADPIKPVAAVFRQAVERHARTTLAADPDALIWAYLEALGPVKAAGDALLDPLQARWMLAIAYSALVAYGRARAGLPPKPASLTIDVGLVPADRPRTRFCDGDDDDGADVPVTTYARR